MIDFITKAYVLKNFAADAIDFIKDKVGDMDIDVDAERWLHKAGLDFYRPGKSAAGGFSVFLVGALIGGALGLAFARRPGAELRAQLKDRALDLWSEGKAKADEISRQAPARFDQPRV